MFNGYFTFTAMIDEAKISRATLYRMIRDGKVRYKEVGSIKLYFLKDVINNKHRKK